MSRRYRVECGSKGFVVMDVFSGKVMKKGNMKECEDWLDCRENAERLRKKKRRIFGWLQRATMLSL